MSAPVAPAPDRRGRPFFSFAPGEKLPAFLAFALYFCVLGGYFAVRPVRETIGTVLGRNVVADLYGWTWVFSIGIIPAYGALCGWLPRRKFLPLIYSLVGLTLAVCGALFAAKGEAHAPTGRFFYVMISVVNLFMVSVLWSFFLELFDAGQVKRLFGFIAAGGTAGALAGPFIASLLVSRIGNSGILFFGAGVFFVAVVVQRALLAVWNRPAAGAAAGATGNKDRPIGGNPLAGIWIVLKSPYLIGIALFVTLLASVNTFLYFEQLDFVTAAFPNDTRARTAFFSRFDSAVQALTIICQVFATGKIASRWGLPVLLTIVPVLMAVGLATFAVVHTMTVLVIVYFARRVGEYSLVRPGREMLFSPLNAETKYKAKNFIDVPVYRGSDYLTGQVLTSPNWIAPGILGAIIAALWAVNGWWLGRKAEAARTAATPQTG